MELEKAGIPAVLIATDEFMALALAEREALGMPALAIVAVPHPIGGTEPETVRLKGIAAVSDVLHAAGTSSGGTS